ncbi:MAG: protein translocase subunit SecF [Pleomorphochaeta sp.]
MKNNLPVIKTRFIALSFSLLLLVIGIVAFIVNGGFNTGIDFESGLSQRVQIAPVGMNVAYSGSEDVLLSVNNGNLTVEERSEHGVTTTVFKSVDYPTVSDLATALETIDGVTTTVLDGSIASETMLSGYGFPATLTSEPTELNFGVGGSVTIEEVRDALSALGNVQVQTVGNEVDQIFQIRLGTGETDTQDSMEKAVTENLQGTFNDGFVVLESNFVGPRFSQTLVLTSLFAVLIAMVLILFYVWIRFRFAYAVSSLIALTHDVLLLLGFIVLFQFEVSSTTIAAVLTIIGYSLNATIVIFDRVRENSSLMKNKPFNEVIEHSVTQSLTRTIMSSVTTVLAVLPLAILASGTIRLFAINLIFGIVIGTYSSNFIAPSFLYWISGGKHVEEKVKEVK